LSPVLLITAIAIRVTSPGPALFKQVRVGKAGQEFACWKFRSMYSDAEERLASLATSNEADGLLFKIRDDPRITAVGRFLRRSSIDELPQLFNVLGGSMSLVGPRPLAVADEAFQGDERRRMLVRPGITGLWQVSGRGDQSWDEAVRLDLYYVENWSLSLDIAIMLRTLLAVVRGSGAY
jgi:lipopolysaccharide/colanic/teichoic acid biosynthesis glycosyltransferase